MSFLFINKTLRLNNLKTRTARDANFRKFQFLLFELERSYICICYYITCMAVPLMMTAFLFHILLSVYTYLQWYCIYCFFFFFLLFKTLLLIFFKCYDVDFIQRGNFYLSMKRDPLHKRGVGRNPLPPPRHLPPYTPTFYGSEKPIPRAIWFNFLVLDK